MAATPGGQPLTGSLKKGMEVISIEDEINELRFRIWVLKRKRARRINEYNALVEQEGRERQQQQGNSSSSSSSRPPPRRRRSPSPQRELADDDDLEHLDEFEDFEESLLSYCDTEFEEAAASQAAPKKPRMS